MCIKIYCRLPSSDVKNSTTSTQRRVSLHISTTSGYGSYSDIMPKVRIHSVTTRRMSDDLDTANVPTLFTAHSRVHNNALPPAKSEKVKRPTTSSTGTSEDWSYFLSMREDYKAASKVAGKELTIQLLECCDDDLRKDLASAQGGSLTNKSETDVFGSHVAEENTMVALETSNGARLKSYTNICNFLIKSKKWDSYVTYT